MSLVEDFETTMKVIVVGNGGVGKSSMIRKFCTGEFTDKYAHAARPEHTPGRRSSLLGQNAICALFVAWSSSRPFF